MFKSISKFNNTSDYLSILNGVLHHFAFQTPININVFLNNSLCFCKYL